jgi:hypothetical protein
VPSQAPEWSRAGKQLKEAFLRSATKNERVVGVQKEMRDLFTEIRDQGGSLVYVVTKRGS